MIEPRSGYLILDKASGSHHTIVDVGTDGEFTYRIRDERGSTDDDYFFTTNITDLNEETHAIVRPPGR